MRIEQSGYEDRQTYFVTSRLHVSVLRHERWYGICRTIAAIDERYLDAWLRLCRITSICAADVDGESGAAVQRMKGGFSISMRRRRVAWKGEVWQAGFSDHRIRNGRIEHAQRSTSGQMLARQDSRFSARWYGDQTAGFESDAVASVAKATIRNAADGVAEATPFQAITAVKRE